MILIASCFSIESRWIDRRPGVRIVRTSMGEEAASALVELEETGDASHLIAIGFCAGIDPRARRGDLILARTIRYRDEEIRIDPELLARARDALDGGASTLHVGICQSVDRVLDRSGKRTLADAGISAADMESGSLARWARERGISFLALRAVLDPVDENLPFASGRPLWMSAARHPIATARVGRAASRVGRDLGRAVNAVVEAVRGGSDA